MTWEKIEITRDNGQTVSAIAPLIISASRSTDIPAFYSDWFFHRLERGYSAWKNPFNGKTSFVSYQKTGFIVFWSKNPAPLLPHLDTLTEKNISCYIQFTLNDYVSEKLEKGVPPLAQRIQTFGKLVEKLGLGSVIWRNDPLVLTDTIGIDSLIEKIRFIGRQLQGKTEKLVFSFADISSYKKVQANLCKAGIRYIEWTPATMQIFAERLAELNETEKWGYTLATCAEEIDLSSFNIQHNCCIDGELIKRIAKRDKNLQFMKSLGLVPSQTQLSLLDPLPPKNAKPSLIQAKDKGQRKACGCIVSKDIGLYNTCPHLCEYCYANTSSSIAMRNYRQSRQNPLSETILGDSNDISN